MSALRFLYKKTLSINSRFISRNNSLRRRINHGDHRPPWEVADVIRIAGSRFRQRYGASLTWPQVKVLRAIARCRTAALGGHLDVCTGCGYVTGISYNSCIMGSFLGMSGGVRAWSATAMVLLVAVLQVAALRLSLLPAIAHR